MLRKNLVLFGLFSLISFDFFLLGIQVISKDVPKNVSWTVLVFFLIVLVVQLIVLTAAARLTNNERIKSAVGGLMLAGNIIAFYISFYDKFLTFHKLQLSLSGIALTTVAATVLYFARRSKPLFQAMLLILVVNSLYTLVSVAQYNPNHGITNPGEVLAQYQKIQFKTKPNIHLIAFDALSPGAVVKANMGLTDLPYVDYLQQNSAIIKNLFSNGSPTRNSFNSQFRLDDGRLQGDGYFAGRLDGPLNAVVHANGYKLETGFSEDYFGSKGPFVDEYNQLHSEETFKDSTLCNFSDKKEKILKLYGLCLIYPHFHKALTEVKGETDWHQKVLDIIAAKAQSNTPWMTVNYIFDPIGHTPSTMDGRDMAARKKYIRVYGAKSKELSAFLPKLISTIKKNDPNSIVFIYGDHGPILSRGIPIKEDPDFNLPDRYAVFGAIYNNGSPCNADEVNYYAKSYTTIERVLGGIFRCLAKDPSQVDKALDFQEAFQFQDFLYDK